MTAPLVISLLLASAVPSDVTVETLPDDHFRVSTTMASGADYELVTRTLLRLRAAAEAQCRGRGAPVSIGALEANQAPGRRNRVVVTETYSCGQPAG